MLCDCRCYIHCPLALSYGNRNGCCNTHESPFKDHLMILTCTSTFAFLPFLKRVYLDILPHTGVPKQA